MKTAGKRESIIKAFRDRGMRITEQRLLILDLLLKADNIDCKEIFYLAHKENRKIGKATVYRTINTLSEMGFIDKRSRLALDEVGMEGESLSPEMKRFKDLTPAQREAVVSAGLEKCGY